jgi:hypothetical protein
MYKDGYLGGIARMVKYARRENESDPGQLDHLQVVFLTWVCMRVCEKGKRNAESESERVSECV